MIGFSIADYNLYAEWDDHYAPSYCNDCGYNMDDTIAPHFNYPKKFHPNIPEDAWDGVCENCFEQKWDVELRQDDQE